MKDLVIDFDKSLDKQALYATLKELKGEYVLKIKKRSKGRSIQENKYYWGCVLAYIQDYTGESKAVLHEIYKMRHIPTVKFLDGSRISTSDMTHEEIWDYIDCVRLDAKIRLGIDIPDPDGVIL